MSMDNKEKAPKPRFQQRMFEWLQRAAAFGDSSRVWVMRFFAPLLEYFAPPPKDWLGNAEWAVQDQHPRRARGLLYGIAGVFLLLLIWAGFAPIDEVTKGEGKVIPSRQLQVVQAVDGGVVEAVFAKEGAVVKKGDVLVRIDPTRFVASFREGRVKAVALRAKSERLTALLNGKPFEPEMPTEPEKAELAQTLNQERLLYEESLNELNEQLTRSRQELSEVTARLRQVERAYTMSSRELDVTKPLLKSGAVSEMDILRLERDLSNADGERRQAQARANQLSTRIREVELAARNHWRTELTDVLAQLNSLDENVSGLADRVKFSEIRSPVHGTVQRVFFNTIGGVVQPGHAVAEIVPADDVLLVEAKVSPKDIAFLHPGQPAIIKFNAYDFSVYGGMQATLQHISPDTITDERGNTFYLVRAATDAKSFREGLQIIPGMTLQLDILTGKKTVLTYLLKPVLRAKANAMTER